MRRVLENRVSIAEVAAVHREALDTQIRALRLHRAVLAVVRYWQLTAAVNGWPPFPSLMAALQWLLAALCAQA